MLDAYKIEAIVLPALKQKMDEIKTEEVKVREEKSRLERELKKAEAQELNEEKLYQFCRSLPTTLATLNFEDRRQILREVVDKIVVGGDDVTIYGIIPMPEDRVNNMLIELPSS